MKNKIILFFLFLILTFTAGVKLFQPPFSTTLYTSHDGEGHVIRIEEFHKGITDGQFPVRLAGRLYHGLSYPFFNFNYPAVYYFGELFTLLGFSSVAVFKILMLISILLGAIGMYLFSRIYYEKIPSYISAIFFTIAPYKFLNLYVRGNIAESMGLALVPFLLFSINRLVVKKNWKFFVVIFSLLILTHNITAMIASLLGFVYFLLLLKENRKEKAHTIKRTVISIFLTLLITVFFWGPVIVEARLTRISELSNDYKDFFPTFGELIYSPWGFGGYVVGDAPGKMSPQIGLGHILIFGIFGFLFLLNFLFHKKNIILKKEILFFSATLLFAFFLASPLSKIIWDNLPPLHFIQIPWRLVGYIILSSSFFAGFLISQFKNSKIQIILSIFLIFFLMYANRNHIRVNQYYEYHSPFETNEIYGPSTTSKDEHTPKNSTRVFEDQNLNGEVIPNGAGESQKIIRNSNYHKYNINMDIKGIFQDNTNYFPGWSVKINGKDAELIPSERLQVSAKKGKSIVEFTFKETWYRKIFNTITLIGFILYLFLLLKTFKKTS